jgi:hypothetical protein
MKITLVLLFAVAMLASAETALPVNAWKMADECVEAVNAPFYIPTVHSLRTIGVNEEVRSHKTGGCFKMDLPGRKIGWVRIEAGRSFIFRKTDSKVLRLAECGNRIYEEAHFKKNVAMSVAMMPPPVVPAVPAVQPPAPIVAEKKAEPIHQGEEVQAEPIQASLVRTATVVTPQEESACLLLSEKKLKGDYREFLQLKCEAQKAELRMRIQSASIIGIAAKNKAITTVTFRNDQGVAIEGSAGWAKHEEKMANIEAGVAKAEAKASRPQGCGWMGCSGVVDSGWGLTNGGGRVSLWGGSITTSCGEGGCNKVL